MSAGPTPPRRPRPPRRRRRRPRAAPNLHHRGHAAAGRGPVPLTQDPLGTCSTTASALAYVMMALGLNIVVGFAGLLDLGYVAFFAIGA